ncbi:trihelix transcription factor ASIL1 [Ricinus communis]|uniref:Transcription factor, putative n=1 Tax=Ricinus communis TaxID=3988 RepID=B9S517_RICCO|nr:trihelix transcription factor ASIL1 [Ricinus communis]EEF41237.1 transcription factor, putative [Ricinus communis]|eukprot:XP_002521086.1 trihelix transcription factor ASIL1 [Ricinus communis]
MATPSPSPSPPPPAEPPPYSSKPRTTKKPHPVPWTHQETVHLIQAYQEKWYSLKRGQLKANQWEEVAETVAARCGYEYNHLAKTVIQCRHKMEKLRKRYREERRRLSLNGTCFWQYFDLMDSLERGPLPISARPLTLIPGNDDNEEDDDEEEEEEEEEEYGYRSRSLSINYILQKPTIVNRFAGSDSRLLPAVMNKRKREEIVEEEEQEEEEEEDSGKSVELELAGEIRAFTERIVGMERKKMQMMKETERWRMEMENKRIEMILDSQRKIVDMISTAFGSPEDLKMEQEF